MTEVEQLGACVFRIPLPLPLEDLDTVNAYAVLDGEGIVLIDPGWATPENEKVLTAALSELGAGPLDVRQILITHAHWDHYTQAIAWQREYGTPVHLGRHEQATVESFETIEGVYPGQVAMLRRAGAPDRADAIEARDWEPYERHAPHGSPDAWIDDGDVLAMAGGDITALWTPGHTSGHVIFHLAEENMLVTGDHVLPRITPSIAFERAPERLALRSYLASLQLVLDRPDAAMLPAHGRAGGSVHERARELLEHHRLRLELVSSLVAHGHRTAAEVAGQMRWTRREHRLDELDDVHGMIAILEAAVHLELLADGGEIVHAGLPGHDEYRPA